MPLIDVSGPSGEPVTSAEIKASARIDGAEFDSQIAIIIPALRRQAEARIGRRLITQTVELVLDEFPVADIDLTLPNMQGVIRASRTPRMPKKKMVQRDPSCSSSPEPVQPTTGSFRSTPGIT